MAKRLTETDLSAFKGPIVPCTISGDQSIYRFSDLEKGEGSWWVSEWVFYMIYQEARDNTSRNSNLTSGTEFRRLYRKHLAVSIDWSSLLTLFRMDIPAGKTVTGWVGVTKDQPMVSNGYQDKFGVGQYSHLPGGMEQYFIEHYDANWVTPVSI